MRVVINQRTTQSGTKTGVGYFTSELAAALKRQHPGDVLDYCPQWLGWAQRGFHYVSKIRQALPWRRAKTAPLPAPTVTTSSNHADLAVAAPPPPAISIADAKRLGPLHHLHLYLDRHFEYFCQQHDVTVYHEPNFLPMACSLPTVVTVHDLSVLRHPEFHPAARVREHEARFVRGIETVARLTADSEFTRRELIEFLGYPAHKIARVYPGIRAHMRPMTPAEIRPTLRRLRLPEQYLLHVGTLEPRKNILMLMQAYAALPAATRANCPLVLAGGWGWRQESIRDYYETKGKAAGVVHLGYVDDRDLPALYNGATGLVIPSHYEGFGLPPAEMLACGGAVLASTAASLAEVVGRCGQILPITDESAWTKTMQRLITDPDWRQSLTIGAQKQAEQFTWEQCAIDAWAAYQAAAGVTAAPTRKAA